MAYVGYYLLLSNRIEEYVFGGIYMVMLLVRISLINRLWRLWVIHLLFAVLSIPVSALAQFLQSKYSSELAGTVSLVLGLVLFAAYFIVLTRVATRILHTFRDGLITGILAALPFLLLIAAALLYLSSVPYNTIGYSFIMLPVMFPFSAWIEQVYPAFPFHVLSLSVPLVVFAATCIGSARKNK